MICECLVELSHVFLEKTFTYKVPVSLEKEIKVGMRVTVPFGYQTLEGFVMKICKEESSLRDLKEVISLVDTYPILNEELLKLGKYIKNTTLSSLISSYQVMLPKALKASRKTNLKIKKEKYFKLNKDLNLENYKFNDLQTKIITLLKSKKLVSKKELESISPSSVKTLYAKKIILLIEKEIYRYNLENKTKMTFTLNEKQQEVFTKVKEKFNTANTFLLHGVTGSGKTNVYMKLIEEVIKNGKTAIFLVPEISLTPQIIDKFTSYFSNIAVLHSKLSAGEKYDEWRKINEGKVDIVIGARSAIFAPLKNIGIIIIDEEHTQSYKQENSPKYNAIDIAKWRSSYHNAPLILGSATPLIESYTKAKLGVYTLLELKERYNGKDPFIKIIDMNKEYKKTNDYFSLDLINNIKDVLEKDEQVILFLNRRGYSNIITCKNCNYTETCPNCDISLTYHKSSNMLRCHYCGYAKKKEELCPNCKEQYTSYGIGTEQVEEQLSKIIKDAKIIRMDVDTTTKKDAHEKIIKAFKNKEYNILLGTQMIAKGLDFENVTLVGIINADNSLNFPDFRSSEITFQLLNQVSGRSGRGKKPGKVLIQTFNPDHYAIKYSKDNDYVSFYNEELKIRKTLGYPPFYHLCLLKISGKDYDLASKMSQKISTYLKTEITKEIILGPSLANIFKLNNEYRFQIIIKYKDINNIKKYLQKLTERFYTDKNIKLDIDFNPLKM